MSAAVETRKIITVLFCDVTGSTELGERLDPEALRRVMLRYFDEMRAVLERHGGTTEKFIGDAVVGIFGIPVVHEDDALRALRAALEMQARLQTLNTELESSWGERLEARIGVNTGEVVADERVAVIAGDAVNVAARLQQSGEPGQILLGDATYQLVAHAVRARRLDERPMKGKAAPVGLWLLEDVEAEAAPMPARPDARLVGRQEEIEALRRAFRRTVSERRCVLATAVGPAGIGKSRLARELCLTLGAEARIAVGRCPSYGEGITFWPVRDVIRAIAGISGDDAADEARAKLRAIAPQEEGDIVAARVAASVGLSDEAIETPDCFWALRRILEAAAARQPLLLVLEDIHWAEATLLDLIEHLSDRAAAPILVLCLARPDLLEARPSWPVTITLEPLEESQARELATQLGCGGLAGRIAARAGGNPLFIEELATMLVEHGGTVEIPPTITALLAARLDRLERDQRIVLQRAAVPADPFWWSAISELCPDDLRPYVPALLQALGRKRLVLPDASTAFPEDAYRFAHLLLRDAAYASLPKELRAELHERFASWLERKAGARAVEYEEVLGYHLEQAYRARAELGPVDEPTRELARRAGAFLGMAGRRAFSRDDLSAALSLLERAMALLPEDDLGRLELVRELSTALWWRGDVDRAEMLLEGLIETAAAVGDRRQEWYGLVERAARQNIAAGAEAATELLRVAHEAVAVFEEVGDEAGLAHAWRRVAHAELIRRRCQEAHRASELALQHARLAGELHEETRIVDVLCTSLLYGPAPVTAAAARCRELLADAAGRPLVAANVLISLAGLEAMRGAFDDARTLVESAGATFEELDLRLAVAGLTQVAGPIELLAGDPAAAERHLRRGLEILRGMSAEAYQAALLGEALYMQKRYDEAAKYAAVGEGAAAPGSVALQVAWRCLRARLDARGGKAAAAAERAREAVAIAAETDALNIHADALLALAEVLAVTEGGDPSESAREAAQLYTRKGNLVASRNAEALLTRHSQR